MGFVIALAVNPNPVANTEDRQWLALDQSGFFLKSHGLAVPADTPNQPARPIGIAGAPGNFAVPRFGWPAAYFNIWGGPEGTSILGGYIEDVATDVVVTDWDPDDVSGYMLDSYGALWPFGSKTPVAPTGNAGSPFGYPPLAAEYGAGPITCIKRLQMHSGNGLPFGLGGHATGFGYMMSMDGVILNWGGPAPGLRSPYQDLVANGLSLDGIPGSSGFDSVRDWWVDPANTGVHYTLFDSGYVYSGTGILGAPIPIAPGTPQADGGVGTTPGAANIGGTRNGWRWMYVRPGQYIVIVHTSGDTWGLRLTGGTEPIPPTLSPPSAHPAWYVPGIAAPYHPGWYQDGAIIPHAAPAHFWQVAITGEVHDDVLKGVLSIGTPTISGNTTTTQPTLNWPYSETFGVPQKSYNVRVYRQSYIDAQGVAFVVGQNAGTDDGWISDRTSTAASDKSTRNLRNGVAYRAYVRVKSAADDQSAWANVGFTMAIPTPATPSSCVATPIPGTYPATLGTISIAAGGSLGAGEFRQFQVSANGGPFVNVWQAEATTLATVVDQFPQTNLSLTYRVRSFKRVPGVVASAWRTAAPVILVPAAGTPSGWRFIDYFALGGPSIVELDAEDWKFEPSEPRGEFLPLTREDWIVTSTGRKGIVGTLVVRAYTTAEIDALWKILGVERSILFQTVHGRQYWVRPTPGTWDLVRAAALSTETTGIRDAFKVELRLVQTRAPLS